MNSQLTLKDNKLEHKSPRKATQNIIPKVSLPKTPKGKLNKKNKRT